MAMMQPLDQLSAYDYDLPTERIAQYPLSRRDESRMMVVHRQTGLLEHRQFKDIGEYLQTHDCLVINNTQVLPNRLIGARKGFTGKVEVFLLHPQAENPTHWTALLRPSRKLKPGTVVTFENCAAEVEILSSSEASTHGLVCVHLNGVADVASLMAIQGQMPIPPYLGRKADERDKERYQTVYAKKPGSHAAPTAGLHFTPELLAQLKQNGIYQAEVTLSVSTGTFKSVHTDNIHAHVMDAEHYHLPTETVDAINRSKQQSGKIVAIGTTSVKTLETAAKNQGTPLSQEESGWSQLFIRPGFDFQVVDVMVTNFHLPKSTLLMLVSAFMGHELMHRAYRTAVEQEYRFYSYGDCMLIL